MSESITTSMSIEDALARNMSFIYDDGPQTARTKLDSAESMMPGMDTADLIVAEFEKSHALFTVSSQKTLIVAQPSLALVGFTSLIQRLLTIARMGERERILAWILDLGGRNIRDLGSRYRFLNVETLISRFKALRSFKDTQIRWDTLQSKVVIVLRDAQSAGDAIEGTDFSACHVLLDRIPEAWAGSVNFRALYGRDFERLNEANYTIFIDKSAGGGAERAIGCYGHARFAHGLRGDRQIRGLDLPFPGRDYEIAFKTVYAAAADFLGMRGAVAECLVDGKKAGEKLRNLGFLLLRLDEFIDHQ